MHINRLSLDCLVPVTPEKADLSPHSQSQSLTCKNTDQVVGGEGSNISPAAAVDKSPVIFTVGSTRKRRLSSPEKKVCVYIY